jgi:hypothetical protein
LLPFGNISEILARVADPDQRGASFDFLTPDPYASVKIALKFGKININ